jgi:hypothetical protein
MQSPPRPAWTATVDRPRPSRSAASDAAKRTLLYAMERGWQVDATPDPCRLVGFQRSGTTLLLMAETCVSDARVFGRKREGINGAIFVAKSPCHDHETPWRHILDR